jgi:hypothetical protein
VRDPQTQLDNAKRDFTLAPGGELRLGPHAIDWLQEFGVPMLGRNGVLSWEGADAISPARRRPRCDPPDPANEACQFAIIEDSTTFRARRPQDCR